MQAQQSLEGCAVGDDGSVGRALDAAAALIGGRLKMAEALGVRGSAIGNWKTRGVPIEYCPRIEALAARRITRRDLRPHDYHLIWPELADPDQPHPLRRSTDLPARGAALAGEA